MIERLRKILLPLLVAAALCPTAHAQTTIESQQDTKPTQEIRKVMRAVEHTEDGRPVSIKLARGGRVAVDNRSTGPIVIIGWDKDFVEAVATSERGAEAVRYSVSSGDNLEQRVWLKADYASRDGAVPPTEQKPEPSESQPKPEATPAGPKPVPTPVVTSDQSGGAKMMSTQTPPIVTPPTTGLKEIRMPGLFSFEGQEDPPKRDGQPLELRLEVRVPRYAEIELIRVKRSPVEITGVEAPLTIVGSKSGIKLKDVGAVEIRTQEGSVDVENASGLVDVVTTIGSIRVRKSRGDVRILSINGEVDVECVRGRVNVDTTSGPVRLAEVYGDVDASAASSSVSFSGALREGGRYRLKSMSGLVEMALRDKPAGFTAELSSYRGVIENEFKLKIKPSSQQEGEVNRRIIGSYGTGQAQVFLDTFDGKVRLARGTTTSECKMQ